MSKYDAETKTWHGPTIPYQYPMDVTLGEIILKSLVKDPERILQICADDDTTLTCNQLRIASVRVAQNLQKIGIEEDDVIGLITHQSHFATSFIIGSILMGAVLNPLDAQMSEDDIRHLYNKSKPKIIICDSEAILKLQNALKTVDFHYTIYSTTDDSASTYHLNAKTFLNPTGDEDNFINPKFSKASNEKLCAIVCSSGTSGASKLVCFSHAVTLYVISIFSLLSVPTPSRSIIFSTIFWTSGFFANLNIIFLEAEIRVLTARKFSIETFIELVEKYEITNVLLAPFGLNTLLKSKKFLSSNTRKLTNFTICGSILSEETRRKFDELLPNRNVKMAYGMTEQLAVVSKPLEYRQAFTVGSLILPNVSIKIVDDDGNTVDNGRNGEICVKPMLTFIGYYNDPESTKQLIDKDGFIKTGDIGYFNDDGMLFVVDRKKDIIKFKGTNVNPSEIENIIEAIEGVQAVAVVGVPDDLNMELIAAAVVKCDGFEKLSEKEIVEYAASKLPEYKQLSGGVHFFKKFPTTLSDKIMKRIILEELLMLKKD